jgi:small GTP-binding protein
MWSLVRGLSDTIRNKTTLKSSILVLGIDGSGKTTLVEAILGRMIPTRKPKVIRPTNGQNSEIITDGKTILRFWDLGGGKHFRKIWGDYLKDATAVIYVVNGDQSDRIHETRKLFDEICLTFAGLICVAFVKCDQGIFATFPSAVQYEVFFVDIKDGKGLDSLYTWIKGTAVR